MYRTFSLQLQLVGDNPFDFGGERGGYFFLLYFPVWGHWPEAHAIHGFTNNEVVRLRIVKKFQL
jgi:hypothetical protein